MKIKETVLKAVLLNLGPILAKMLPASVITAAIDGALDAAEKAIAKSENKIDDTIVLPILNTIREALNIQDGFDD